MFAQLGVDFVHVGIGVSIITAGTLVVIFYVEFIHQNSAGFHEIWFSVAEDFTVRISMINIIHTSWMRLSCPVIQTNEKDYKIVLLLAKKPPSHRVLTGCAKSSALTY